MKPDGRVLKRSEWEVREISHADAKAFVAKWHYTRGAANTSVERHGLFRVGTSRLMGCSLWMPPTRAAGVSIAGEEMAQSVLNLSRLAVHPACPTNAASFLLSKSMRMLNRGRWPWLVTYADEGQGHTGAIYLATNWTFDKKVKGEPGWVLPDGRMVQRKRGGRNLTVQEFREMGAVRCPPLPKLRFVHVIPCAARELSRPCR